MAEKSTFIKLDRNILKWRWWGDNNTLKVFLWLLISVNTADHDFEADTIHRGEIATSIENVTKMCQMSYGEVRTALNHLKKTGEVTIRRRSKYLVITVVEYNRYQDVNNHLAITRQSLDNHSTIKSQQYKNIKKDNKEKKEKNNIGRSAPPSPSGGSSGDVGGWNNAKSDRMKPRDMGTADDIPERYRDRFTAYADYWDWRNQ